MAQIKGIDVSKWQGTIDWAKVAADGVMFAMIRLGYGSKDGSACGLDGFYQKNVEGALKNGIAVGCYFYSYALTVEAVKKEAAFVIQNLAKYKGRILYPIAFDIEDSTQAGLGKDKLTSMVTAFCSALEAAGYYASFYCNADWAKNRLDMTALARFDFWLAQWASAPTYKGHTFNMWQSSSKGSVAGISGNVDMDTAFVDYEAVIKQNKLNGYTGEATDSGKQEGGNDMNQRQQIVNAAASYIGCKESDGSHKKIIDLYNSHKPLARGYAVKYTDAWCATFVSAVAIKCGVTDILPTECGCEKQIELFKKLGSWQENDAYIPQPGDVIFYDWDDSGSGDNTGYSDHVGIVEKVSGSTITIIEGNMSNAVGRRNLKVNGRYIRGYGVPKYTGNSSSGNAEPEEKPESTPGKTLAFKVGDRVKFTGSKHYTSANASSGPAAKACEGKVTAIYATGKHPYHVIGSGVYGWVDVDDVEAIGEISVGDVVQFKGGPHYTSANATGYKTTPKAGPARVTAIKKGAKHPYHVVHTDRQSSVYGWVDADKVSK